MIGIRSLRHKTNTLVAHHIRCNGAITSSKHVFDTKHNLVVGAVVVGTSCLTLGLALLDHLLVVHHTTKLAHKLSGGRIWKATR